MSLFTIFWTIFMFFIFLAWIWVLIGVVTDVLRSDDLNGFTKALWVLGIIIVPWLGVLTYLVIRGDGMAERNEKALVKAEEMRRAHIQGGGEMSVAEQLSKLAELRDKGVITEVELQAQKAKLLA